MGRGWRVGRIGGIELRVDPSLFLLFVLIAFNIWDFLMTRYRIGGPRALLLAVATASTFELSILAHELAHALMARIRGIRVYGITLYMLGGLTYTDSDRSPGDEFATTVVGPISSAAIGGLFLLVDALGREVLSPPVSFLARYMAVVNLVMAAFNLLPGFPMDGGRLLLAGLWRLLNDRTRATRIAARVGQGMALLIVAFGVWLLIRTGDVWGLWPALIGWFLYQGATSALTQAETRRRLDTAVAGDVMSPPPPTVSPDLGLASAMSRYLKDHDGEAFPVMENGHVVGFISLRLASSASVDQTVREAMATPTAVIEASPGERLSSLAERMGESGALTAMVVDDGRLVGVIEPEDLDRFLQRRGARGMPGERRKEGT
jgi:Zn-dependent protease/predicted transcriptional regulator